MSMGMVPGSSARFEHKYWVDDAQVAEALRHLGPWLQADRWGGRPDELLTSLYLDSPERCCQRWHEDGAPDRWKLRVRVYGDEPATATAAYFEIKRKTGGVVRKRRARVPADRVAALLAGRYRGLPELPDEDRAVLDDFLGLALAYRLGPALLLRYRREAWAAAEPLSGARLTLDRGITFQPAPGATLVGDARRWRPLDTAREHGASGRRALLELKFRGAAPAWMGELLARTDARRTGCSKYVLAGQRLADPFADAEGWLARASV